MNTLGFILCVIVESVLMLSWLPQQSRLLHLVLELEVVLVLVQVLELELVLVL